MEWYVDTWERNGSEPSLELDVAFRLLLLLRLVETTRDNIRQHLLDLLDSELLGELHIALITAHRTSNSNAYLLDINLLDLEVVQNVRQSLERKKLSGANVLLSLGAS